MSYYTNQQNMMGYETHNDYFKDSSDFEIEILGDDTDYNYDGKLPSYEEVDFHDAYAETSQDKLDAELDTDKLLQHPDEIKNPRKPRDLPSDKEMLICWYDHLDKATEVQEAKKKRDSDIVKKISDEKKARKALLIISKNEDNKMLSDYQKKRSPPIELLPSAPILTLEPLPSNDPVSSCCFQLTRPVFECTRRKKSGKTRITYRRVGKDCDDKKYRTPCKCNNFLSMINTMNFCKEIRKEVKEKEDAKEAAILFQKKAQIRRKEQFLKRKARRVLKSKIGMGGNRSSSAGYNKQTKKVGLLIRNGKRISAQDFSKKKALIKAKKAKAKAIWEKENQILQAKEKANPTSKLIVQDFGLEEEEVDEEVKAQEEAEMVEFRIKTIQKEFKPIQPKPTKKDKKKAKDLIKKEDEKTWTTQVKKKKKIKLGFTSLIQQKKNEKKAAWEKRNGITPSRTEAFSDLSSHKKMRQVLRCTRLCKSVLKKTRCLHGNNCRFAHSIDQLVEKKCRFGLRCKLVNKKTITTYKNKKSFKICECFHPAESKMSFCTRTGLSCMPCKPKVMPKPKKKILIKKSFLMESKTSAWIVKPKMTNEIAPITKPTIGKPRVDVTIIGFCWTTLLKPKVVSKPQKKMVSKPQKKMVSKPQKKMVSKKKFSKSNRIPLGKNKFVIPAWGIKAWETQEPKKIPLEKKFEIPSWAFEREERIPLEKKFEIPSWAFEREERIPLEKKFEIPSWAFEREDKNKKGKWNTVKSQKSRYLEKKCEQSFQKSGTVWDPSSHLKAGIILQNRQGKVLIVLGKEHNKWSFPKGKIEPSESASVCARRELREETGYDIKIPDNSRTWKKGNSTYFKIKLNTQRSVIIPDCQEIQKIRWISQREFIRLRRDQVNSDMWQWIKQYK